MNIVHTDTGGVSWMQLAMRVTPDVDEFGLLLDEYGVQDPLLPVRPIPSKMPDTFLQHYAVRAEQKVELRSLYLREKQVRKDNISFLHKNQSILHQLLSYFTNPINSFSRVRFISRK